MSFCADARAALRVMGRDHISHSAISTFQQCPLRFRFRYVDRLPETEVSSSLVFGASIHRAIEFHFIALAAGLPSPGLGMLLRAFWAEWNARSVQALVRFAKGEDLRRVRVLAEQILLTFLLDDVARPEGAIIGVERELRGRVTQDTPKLLARIDLITSAGDEVVITDFKTSRSKWSEHNAFCASDQLLRYAELVQQLLPGKRIRAQFVVLTKSQTPTVQRQSIDTCERLRERSKRIVRQVWSQIQEQQYYPAPSPFHCPHCPYRRRCHEWS